MLKKELEQTLTNHTDHINRLTTKVNWYEGMLFFIGFISGICAMCGFFGWIDVNLLIMLLYANIIREGQK